LIEELFQDFDVLGPLPGVGLAQELLDLLPGQAGLAQDPPDGVASDPTSQGRLDPLAELLQGPPVAGEPVIDRLGVADGLDDLLGLGGRKKGGRLPVRR
jgi:hypothetical protein